MRVAWFVIVSAMLAGCGSGGGGAAAVVDPPPASHDTTPTTALVVISTRGPSADTVVYGVACKLYLPAGVTVSADPSDGTLGSGVLKATDGGATAGGKYQKAAAGAPGFVEMNILDPGGFTVGGLGSLTVSVAADSTATADLFSMEGFTARDASGAVMTGITPLWAVQVP